MMKKVFALFLSLVVVASICCVPAMAASVDATFTISGRRVTTAETSYSGDVSTPGPGYVNFSNLAKTSAGNLYLDSVVGRGSDEYYGEVGVYFTVFPYVESNSASSLPPANSITPNEPVVGADTVSASYTDASGLVTSFVPEYELISGSDVGGTNRYGEAIRVSAVVSGIPESNPVGLPQVFWSSCYWPYQLLGSGSSYSTSYIRMYVSNIRVISSVIPGDLVKLEEIADTLVQQNQILSAFYGDVIGVLNAVYERTGDMLSAQNMTNDYLQKILPLIQSLDNTGRNIYSLLSTQFQLLISTIQTESDDIQGAIDASVSRLIAYLDNVFSGSVGNLPGETDTMEGWLSQETDFQSTWETNALDRVNNVDFAGFAFPTVILSGLSFVGIIFGNLWRNLGEYQVVYTFPLFLGLALLIIGKVSKSGGRSRSSPTVSDESSIKGE